MINQIAKISNETRKEIKTFFNVNLDSLRPFNKRVFSKNIKGYRMSNNNPKENLNYNSIQIFFKRGDSVEFSWIRKEIDGDTLLLGEFMDTEGYVYEVKTYAIARAKELEKEILAL